MHKMIISELKLQAIYQMQMEFNSHVTFSMGNNEYMDLKLRAYHTQHKNCKSG